MKTRDGEREVGMEALVSTLSSSNGRPRNLRLGLFSSFALALTAIVFFSGFVHKSIAASVQKETRDGGGHGEFQEVRTDQGDIMASTDQRFNWSHLVGTNAEEAKKKIKEEHPHLNVLVVPQDGMMTMDYNLQRVRIFKDKKENVASVPMRG